MSIVLPNWDSINASKLNFLYPEYLPSPPTCFLNVWNKYVFQNSCMMHFFPHNRANKHKTLQIMRNMHFLSHSMMCSVK